MQRSFAADTQLRDRFEREARAAAGLQHPNIVTIHDFGEAKGHLYIVMEYVAGADLAEIIRARTPLSLNTRLNIVIGVLEGLSYAHARGIVHRDVKPANIRLLEGGRVKIMDFGIAHLAGSDITNSGRCGEPLSQCRLDDSRAPGRPAGVQRAGYPGHVTHAARSGSRSQPAETAADGGGGVSRGPGWGGERGRGYGRLAVAGGWRVGSLRRGHDPAARGIRSDVSNTMIRKGFFRK